MNRKFEFLQKSRVAIDLCAAPGGWLQVCSKYMPVSSVIIGVDLVSIKPIPNVITLTHDITSDSCRSALKRELKTWKADLVLNDGAPNVGKSWVHDAFIQNRLTLSSVKLATEFLMKGGTFVTKVFRSKDYNSLIWLLTKLFKKVNATKPAASRNESAEIFIVATGFLAPEKIDARFFNPNYLFEDVSNEEAESKKARVNLLKPASKQKNAKALGYSGDSMILRTSVKASDFIKNSGHLDLLASANEMILDDPIIKSHPATTSEIIECAKDIKVLGRKELLSLIRWRKKLRKELAYDKLDKSTEVNEGVVEEVDDEDDDGDVEDVANDEEERALKRKRKKLLKERKKLQERMNLKMIHKNDQLIDEGDAEVFSLSKLTSKYALNNFEEFNMDDIVDDDDDDVEKGQNISKYITYDKDEKEYWIEDEDEEKNKKKKNNSTESLNESDDVVNFDDEDEDEDEPASKKSKKVTFDTSFPEVEEEDNQLIADLGTKLTREKKAQLFLKTGLLGEMFSSSNGTSNDHDSDIEVDSDEEEILETLAQLETNDAKNTRVQRKNAQLLSKSEINSKNKNTTPYDSSEEDDDEEENAKSFMSSDDSSSDDDDENSKKKRKKKHPKCQADVKLDPESLALAEAMITSSKVKRDLMDDAWNRHTLGGLDDAPSWFRKDEQMYNRRPLSDAVDPSVVAKYRARAKELNVRPIKKVAEAKARKKKRALMKMAKLTKKAENITNTPDMDEKEKSATLRNLYKKAMSKGTKKEVKYVVAKKGSKNQRPSGHKGKYKMVDPRMKKDNMKKKRLEKQKGGKKKGPSRSSKGGTRSTPRGGKNKSKGRR